MTEISVALTPRERHYPESRIGGFTEVDGTIAFYTRVNALLQPDTRLLDVGCGRGALTDDPVPWRRQLRQFRGRTAHVLGLDVSEAGQNNPNLDEFRLIPSSGQWPVEDATADLLVADWVLEHVPHPGQFFDEARRALVPGGWLCLRTTNRLGYVGWLGRMVPNGLHPRLVARAQRGQPERRGQDVFPAFYRCNTRGRLQRSLRDRGFEPLVYGHNAEPAYFDFSPAAYALMAWVHKQMPAWCRTTLFGFGRRRP